MSARQDKKLRQLYRREVAGVADRQINMIAEHIRPKPKWMPRFLYRKLFKLIIKA